MKFIFYKSISIFFYLLNLKMFSLPKGIIVLLYHRVTDNLEPNVMVVSTKAFRQQMQYLYEQGYKVIGLSELVSDLKTQKLLSSKTVLITFDDGYRGNYLYAYPILKEFAFPAAIFLTTGIIETDKQDPKYKNMLFPDILSWENIREMAQNGIEFGVHTVNHPPLTQISVEEARQEIEESKKVVSEMVDLGVCAFSYPYGEYNEEIKGLVREAGFDCAFTTKAGINRKGRDLWELKRIAINGNDSLFDFKKKIIGGYIGGYEILHKLAQIGLGRVLRKLYTH